MSWWTDVWRSMFHEELGFGATELRSGRNLARQSADAELEIAPGSVSVTFSDRGAHTAQLSIGALTKAQCNVLCDSAADHPALVAGVLLGELPAAYDAHWQDLGIRLVPSLSEVSADCTCDDWAERCRHLAALGELVARLIETDAYVLLTLRGWSRESFVDGLRERRAEALGVTFVRSDQPRGEDPGVDAARRFDRSVASPPAMRPVPRRPGKAAVLAHPPADAGLDRSDFEHLIADAALRASAVLSEGVVAGLHLDVAADTARRASGLLDDPAALEGLAERAGIDPLELESQAIAWSVGGADGLAVCTESWDADPAELEAGRQSLGGKTRTSANTVFGGNVQLRLDPKRHWWRFRADPRLGWLLESGGLADPDDL